MGRELAVAVERLALSSTANAQEGALVPNVLEVREEHTDLLWE